MPDIGPLVYTLLCIGLLTNGLAQPPADMPSFRPPVNHAMRLSGTFGELRTGHFHAGLDIKSEKGTWGDPVFSVDDGYIARIVVSPSGFGKALYINHPQSGLTTVYGHLQEFDAPLQSYVYAAQKDQESFALDLTLPKEKFPVKKGDKIALMGSTGFSFGPHLHFEVRKTLSEERINPALHHLRLEDHQEPTLTGLTLYHLDHQLIEYRREEFPSSELHSDDTLSTDAWRIGLGIEAFDPHNAGRNKNGIYSATIKLDSDTIYHFSMDSMSVKDGLYFNAQVDYERMVSDGSKIYRCYRLPTDQSSIHRLSYRDGIIPLYRDRVQKVTASISDLSGNKINQSFFIRRAEKVSPIDRPVYQYHIKAGIPDTIRSSYLEVIWPANALYQDCYLQYSSGPSSAPGVYSAQYRLDRDRLPLFHPLQLKIRPFPFPDSLRNKLTIVQVDIDGKQRNRPAKWIGSWLGCSISRLGTYQVVADTIPPTIDLISKRSSDQSERLEFTISDNLPGPGGLKFNASLNDRWVLAEYDLKRDRVTCQINRSEWEKGSYQFKLLVEDTVGNVSEYEYRLHFK
ncbi:MAG: M23 family metallopeptidase [Saprospiraceae bacterium]|nr:M23 family metallopeptidase [Saprospiraceae bacterium]